MLARPARDPRSAWIFPFRLTFSTPKLFRDYFTREKSRAITPDGGTKFYSRKRLSLVRSVPSNRDILCNERYGRKRFGSLASFFFFVSLSRNSRSSRL